MQSQRRPHAMDRREGRERPSRTQRDAELRRSSSAAMSSASSFSSSSSSLSSSSSSLISPFPRSPLSSSSLPTPTTSSSSSPSPPAPSSSLSSLCQATVAFPHTHDRRQTTSEQTPPRQRRRFSRRRLLLAAAIFLVLLADSTYSATIPRRVRSVANGLLQSNAAPSPSSSSVLPRHVPRDVAPPFHRNSNGSGRVKAGRHSGVLHDVDKDDPPTVDDQTLEITSTLAAFPTDPTTSPELDAWNQDHAPLATTSNNSAAYLKGKTGHRLKASQLSSPSSTSKGQAMSTSAFPYLEDMGLKPRSPFKSGQPPAGHSWRDAGIRPPIDPRVPSVLRPNGGSDPAERSKISTKDSDNSHEQPDAEGIAADDAGPGWTLKTEKADHGSDDQSSNDPSSELAQLADEWSDAAEKEQEAHAYMRPGSAAPPPYAARIPELDTRPAIIRWTSAALCSSKQAWRWIKMAAKSREGIALTMLTPKVARPVLGSLPLIPNDAKRDFVFLFIAMIVLSAVAVILFKSRVSEGEFNRAQRRHQIHLSRIASTETRRRRGNYSDSRDDRGQVELYRRPSKTAGRRRKWTTDGLVARRTSQVSRSYDYDDGYGSDENYQDYAASASRSPQTVQGRFRGGTTNSRKAARSPAKRRRPPPRRTIAPPADRWSSWLRPAAWQLKRRLSDGGTDQGISLPLLSDHSRQPTPAPRQWLGRATPSRSILSPSADHSGNESKWPFPDISLPVLSRYSSASLLPTLANVGSLHGGTPQSQDSPAGDRTPAMTEYEASLHRLSHSRGTTASDGRAGASRSMDASTSGWNSRRGSDGWSSDWHTSSATSLPRPQEISVDMGGSGFGGGGMRAGADSSASNGLLQHHPSPHLLLPGYRPDSGASSRSPRRAWSPYQEAMQGHLAGSRTPSGSQSPSLSPSPQLGYMSSGSSSRVSSRPTSDNGFESASGPSQGKAQDRFDGSPASIAIHGGLADTRPGAPSFAASPSAGRPPMGFGEGEDDWTTPTALPPSLLDHQGQIRDDYFTSLGNDSRGREQGPRSREKGKSRDLTPC